MPQLKLIYICVIFTLALSAISALTIIWVKNTLPAKVPLFYSLSWGQHQLAPVDWLFLLPSIAICIMGINLIISKQLHESQLILRRMLMGVILVSDLLILITIVRILSIYL